MENISFIYLLFFIGTLVEIIIFNLITFPKDGFNPTVGDLVVTLILLTLSPVGFVMFFIGIIGSMIDVVDWDTPVFSKKDK
jgi:hypothetical protein